MRTQHCRGSSTGEEGPRTRGAMNRAAGASSTFVLAGLRVWATCAHARLEMH